MTMTSPWRLGAGVVVAGAALAGCRSRPLDYHLQIRNDTAGTIRARIVREDDLGTTLFDRNMFPKDRAEVSLQRRPAREELILQADSPNNPAAPARMPLSSGQSVILITREGDEGPVKLDLLRGR